ncbi:MAG: sigma-54-dependent Fis family transcriptional regulator, partial [Deltaproteobacteria bacterium]|nr:sigma-54-dependent Fis family transcriptional regulator [Deltaproteobacteria bacterium]
LPPLREMEEDIKIIADHLRKIFNIELKKQVNGFSEDVWPALLEYSWPGNVRELSNCIERAMIFIEKNQIQPEDLNITAQLQTQEPQRWILPADGIVLEDVERRLIVSALNQSDNNKSKAARLLGLTRDTLRYRLEKYQLG